MTQFHTINEHLPLKRILRETEPWALASEAAATIESPKNTPDVLSCKLYSKNEHTAAFPYDKVYDHTSPKHTGSHDGWPPRIWSLEKLPSRSCIWEFTSTSLSEEFNVQAALYKTSAYSINLHEKLRDDINATTPQWKIVTRPLSYFSVRPQTSFFLSFYKNSLNQPHVSKIACSLMLQRSDLGVVLLCYLLFALFYLLKVWQPNAYMMAQTTQEITIFIVSDTSWFLHASTERLRIAPRGTSMSWSALGRHSCHTSSLLSL